MPLRRRRSVFGGSFQWLVSQCPAIQEIQFRQLKEQPGHSLTLGRIAAHMSQVDDARPATRILFVCLGNICRSPTAEAVMRGLVTEYRLAGDYEIDSAGTGDWHVGHPPDDRAVGAAAQRGLALEGVARQVTTADFERFDLLVAMDRSNRAELLRLAPDESARERVSLLRGFGGGGELDVPDPYYGGVDGFEQVLDIIERSCEALLEETRARHVG